MNISSLEDSFFKLLYDKFEVAQGIKIFENVYYVDFELCDKWIVIDSLSHSTGSLPKAMFNLHISIKNGLMNEKVTLTKLVDAVTKVISPGFRFDLYNSDTELIESEAEVVSTNLLPIMRHLGGGSFRSLTVGIVYAGDIPE